MPKIEFTKRFRKDIKKWGRSGQSLDPLYEFIRLTRDEWPPSLKYEAHILSGDLDGIWDIHLRQNWVLLVQFHGNTVRFLRMGTHAELGL